MINSRIPYKVGGINYQREGEKLPRCEICRREAAWAEYVRLNRNEFFTENADSVFALYDIDLHQFMPVAKSQILEHDEISSQIEKIFPDSYVYEANRDGSL